MSARLSPALLILGLPLAIAGNVHAQDHAHHQAKPATTEKRPDKQPDRSTEHAGHDMPTAENEHVDMEPAPARYGQPVPALTDADRAAAFAPVTAHAMHDDAVFSFVRFNRLEAWKADTGSGQAWEGQAWIGKDLDKLWLRSEGERETGRTHAADLEVLYGRAVARWWDVVAGVRHDVRPGPTQTWAAVGVVGLAPQKFEVEATAYFGESGQTAARIEVEYELLLTNRLVLQPLVEVNLFGKNDPQRGIGSGLGTAEAGLRLRYEFTRRFAPYIGVVHERAYGNTAELRRADGEDVEDTRIVAGVRLWF